MEKALKEAGVIYTRPQDLISEVTEHLSQGKIVALFRGRMEYGPRALGNRSIIAQATDPQVNDWLNKRLKRSEFMPFAPIMKKEDLPLYFSDFEKCEKALEFMTITLDALPLAKKEAPAVIHVDGTARPQIVKKEINPFVWGLLDAYTKRTGLRVLINTSYNMHEEPIVCTPDDALRAFLSGGLDVLAMGPFIVRL
jgi:carbamoyltransferase